MTAADLPAAAALEAACHSHPWSLGNLADALASGYHMPTLWQPSTAKAGTKATPPPHLLGLLVAMPGVQEAHLLTLSIAPASRGQGLAQRLLHNMHTWARQQGACQIWLEVRISNHSAQALYARMGYEKITLRKNYYLRNTPLDGNPREDALIMRKQL